jgi:hypothetical protein
LLASIDAGFLLVQPSAKGCGGSHVFFYNVANQLVVSSHNLNAFGRNQIPICELQEQFLFCHTVLDHLGSKPTSIV